jgi:type II secretory pathway pseudopilin PulG
MNMRYMKSGRGRSKESGYVLLAVLLTMTLMLILLSVEAPRIAQQIKRDKEEEMIHRGKDYATAVKRFVHKNGGRYPVSIEQLENTNHVRFLRKKYVDPMTGDSDWKMVHVGEAEIKIPAPNPGLSGGGGTNPGLFGSGSGGQGVGAGGQGVGAGGQGVGAGAQNNPALPNTLTTNPIGNGQSVGGGQIMGVASVSKGHAIKEFNDKDQYDEWYFVYDLRLEQSGGSGVTVAAPRAGGSTTGGSGAPKNPDAQPTPVQTPAPTPTPQN